MVEGAKCPPPVARETWTPASAEADDIGHPIAVHIGKLARIGVIAAPTLGVRTEEWKFDGGWREIPASCGESDMEEELKSKTRAELEALVAEEQAKEWRVIQLKATPARLIGYIDRSAILFGHAARACTSASVTPMCNSDHPLKAMSIGSADQDARRYRPGRPRTSSERVVPPSRRKSGPPPASRRSLRNGRRRELCRRTNTPACRCPRRSR